MAAGRQHVFYDHDFLPRVQDSFDLLARPVIFLLIADENARFTAGHRRHDRQRHSAQFGAGDSIDIARYPLGQKLAQLNQDVWLGFEAVFVEVIAALSAAAEREIAVKQ